jgi:hypothetical protein
LLDKFISSWKVDLRNEENSNISREYRTNYFIW